LKGEGIRQISWAEFEAVELRAGSIVLAVPERVVPNGAKLA
jgi:hypothetical protein